MSLIITRLPVWHEGCYTRVIMRWLLRRILLSLSIVVSAGLIQAQHSKVASDLDDLLGRGAESAEVLIQYTAAPSSLDVAKLHGH